MSSAFYLPVSAVLSLAIVFDFFNTLRKKGGLGEAKFVLHNIYNAMNYASIILLIAVIGLNLYVNRIIKDVLMLYIAYWMFLLLVRSVLYIAKTGGIYEAGIWFSGHFYPWEAVKAYYCDKNTGRVGLAVAKNFMGYGYRGKLRLQAHKAQLAEIDGLLSDRVK